MIPSYSWKTISGWINYSCKVTSHKMSENEMGYRGSKSDLSRLISVKEQRVDGSWHGLCVASPCLRCTLMDFERNYRVRILSWQI